MPQVTVGGGFGSFTLVDVLRIQGVAAGALRVLSSRDAPWQSWEYLTRVPQLPAGERIRSRGSGLSAGVCKLGGVVVTIVLVVGATVPSINTTALLGAVPLLLAVLVVAAFGVETRRRPANAGAPAAQPADA